MKMKGRIVKRRLVRVKTVMTILMEVMTSSTVKAKMKVLILKRTIGTPRAAR